jgi:hypothetical protein
MEESNFFEYELMLSSDVCGKPLDGSRNYVLRFPGNIPACKYWSVIVYDIKNRLIIRNSQLWPSIHSNRKDLCVNADGSVDICFGPKIPKGNESNWIQTIKNRSWFMIIRLYDLQTKMSAWSPGQIEPVR